MYYSKGRVARQAHVGIPEGTCEEEYARNGFSGRSVHLYRSEPPVGWVDIEGDLRPESFSAEELPGLGGSDYLESRIPFLYNDDVRLSFSIVREAMPYHFRNADGDEVIFVHRGTGELETDFGPLQYEKGDYLVIPRGTVYRLDPTEETALLIIESAGEVKLPDKGVIGKHALFDPAVLNVPTPRPPKEEKGKFLWKLKVKRAGALSTVTYPFNPINTLGWKGELTVWQLNIRDIRPIHCERYHLPPTAHITFLLRNAVLCTFLPRPLETGDPEALRVPFFHSNIDFDEVLFYHDGDFFSRQGIEPGMVTFHPQGLHHGPQPGAAARAKGKTRTDEKAVMLDTRNPLKVSPEAKSIASGDYWKSWMGYARSGKS
jgi:homogentisate 1,2-dioxygenase